ncbi:D-isomer specific 2-hydroxyacid dehydrogenase NAD-binding protein [Denitrovibrio acetiphilus DSM 12809]|uniref:D-isomer specific 2-hydroxyacid dehydrogenase NAD-binding protein n=1 Tax=Denitrovibrio acetiphilus (strain DSM 12809 / NBRC 114555 / N2460) TaxID=522772 RepID=D4H301_DENA2|nr:D-glycerate dehydrogenase [Denitrovibrio acetiphilus]ADD69024.1 D-isomer specific 2-hydroxyacid dehydrogenase NAD-binding protein [Denitrovibrio acetiphilus DSM 12809]
MKILITAELPFDIEGYLKGHELDYNKGKQLSAKELAKRAEDADGIISMLSDKIDRELMESCKNLKVVANYAVGYNNIDVQAASELGITVCNTPDVLTQTTAELGFALMITAARRVSEGDAFTRNKKFKGWEADLFLGMDMHGKTLGVFGFGRIGQAVAQMASGFNMDIIYSSRTKKHQAELLTGASRVSFDDLVRQSDFLIITAPSTPETHHKFTLETFVQMKSSAVLVNIGRGDIIKERDLVKALENKLIFAAGLDVYEDEPKIDAGLFKLSNAVLAPHIGSGSFATREAMAKMCCDAVTSVFKDEKPACALN